MAAEARVFSLSVPSDPRMLSVARTFVEAVGHACFLERPIVHALVMATGEAITNIVRHAHRGLDSAQMHVQMEVLADMAVLTFRDQGEPFDIDAVPHLNPGELRIGGRGVYLIRTLMDEVSCQARGPGQRGNVLRMVKRFSPSAPARNCG